MPLNQYVLPWDSQPQERAELDWENPLTQKLVFLNVGGQTNNLVTNAAPTYNGGVVTRSVSSKGIANETATGGANRRDYDNLPLPADGRMTHGAVFIPRSNAVFSYLINRGFGVPGNELLWLNDTDKKIRFSFGNTGVFVGTGSATLDQVNIVTGSTPENGLTASNTVVYLNGVRQANFGGSADASARNTSSTLIVAGRSSDTARQFAGGLLLTVSWDRVLTENEHASFHGNPWQLFAPRSIWVPSSSLKVPTRRRLIEQVTPWESQPQEPVGIDWGNPTTSGLVFAWEGSVPSHDLRSSAATIPFSTGIGSGVSLHGRTVTFSGSQANQSFGLSAFNGLAAATGATYDILVFFSGANPTAKFFSQWDLGAGVQRWLLESSGGNLVWVAGDTDGNGASRSRFDLSGAFPAAGWYRITASWGGAGVNSLWINGTKRSPSTVSSGCTVINSTTMGLFIGGSGSSPLNGAVAFARIWRRGLQDAEIASIQNSGAWQLFTPRQEWILSSSEVLMPTLSLPTLTGIGSTTARPRVSITY